ncbi:hypothetical protein [Microseira wollei]|uniref:Uncharacterized protein n=1 Tax=Microseira wollei NIES-4236 TaxID=2530354 RepID=A0AAV3X7M8_9CYAN|nr:hypothetical protein [Microseira wollei]GET35367.1 hypothetical protein MiSe_01090 [Microseira wollei NIES-4236]
MYVKLFTKLALSFLAGTAIASIVLPQPTWAQFTDAQPLQDWQNPESNRDPFSGKGDGADGAFDVFNMIHRANLGPTRSLGEFSEEQQESLDAAAAEFRKQQQQRLQSPNGVVPVTGGEAIAPPQSGN